ncbi:MAG TPA: glycosyl transferase family 2, partial [Thermoanaerobaculia bacterium]|nr:glycosyl transferase family 2 [Thermoanaerobaculia bacterium]
TGRKLLPRILRSPLPARVKLEAFVHLTNNLAYPLMVVLALLVFPAMLLRRGDGLGEVLLIDLPLFLGATCSVLVFYGASQVAGGGAWRRELRYLPALMGLGVGLSLSNARAALGGLVRRGGAFVRTPKYGIEHGVEPGVGEAVGRGEWRRLRYRAGGSLTFLLEGAFALYFAGVTALAVSWGMWASVPFLVLFLHGYGYMFVLSLASARHRSRPVRRRPGSAAQPRTT